MVLVIASSSAFTSLIGLWFGLREWLFVVSRDCRFGLRVGVFEIGVGCYLHGKCGSLSSREGEIVLVSYLVANLFVSV